MSKPPPSTAAPRGLDFGRLWPYSPAPERPSHPIPDRRGLYIDGEFVPPRSGTYFPTVNPANGEILAEVAEAGAEDVARAVDAARRARSRWARLPGRVRGRYLFRIARRIQERARELAILESLDGGKPIRESRDMDIPEAAKHYFYHAGWADKIEYAFPGREVRPIGVCGQIIPWNFPFLIAAWKIAPALACGNTVVLKPAETTPLSALLLAEILQEIELPPGVVNILPGSGATGAVLAAHPKVSKISFTGSTAVGKEIAAASAGQGKRLTLELGGKSPQIIFEDASIDQAVEGVVQGIYFNQGHVCCAGSRLFVQEGIREEVLAKLDLRLRNLRIGDPLDKNTDIGAVNNPQQLERIHRYLRVAADEGAVRHEGGVGELPDRGYWCRPCYLSGVQPSHVVAREEIFGPVLAVMSFRTIEEALSRANNTPYGLAAGIWTDKGAKVFEVAARLRAGVVWCNSYNRFDAASPFGGMKESGFGREGGLQGLRPYVELR